MSGTELNALRNLIRASVPGLRELTVLKKGQCTSNMSRGKKKNGRVRRCRKGNPVGKINSNPRIQPLKYSMT